MSDLLPATETATSARTANRTRHTRTLPVEPKSVTWNPTPAQLRQFAEAMPNAKVTEFGNVNVATRVVSRSKLSTFIATDDKQQHSDQTMTRAEYDRIAALQNDYIRSQDMLVVEGYIGNDSRVAEIDSKLRSETERAPLRRFLFS